MKKLAFDSSNWKLIGTINDLIDLVNSQQEAIERLEKISHEVKAMGEALVTHYNDPSAHKQELEAPIDDCDTESTNWPSVDVQNILYKHFYVDDKSHQKVMMADYEIRTLLEKYEAVYEKPEMVSKARYAEKLGIHNNPHEHVYRCQDCDKTQAEVEDTDTHRTVTLRIPKGMTVGKAIVEIYNYYRVANRQMDMWLDDYLVDMSDTDLQKALAEKEVL